jgi:hypothetical protein
VLRKSNEFVMKDEHLRKGQPHVEGSRMQYVAKNPKLVDLKKNS